MKKQIMLTGDRPTGKFHLGHYVGSLKRRLELQNTGKFDDMYILIADGQALTDNAENPKKIHDNIIEAALAYLSVGLDPNKVTLCIQSALPALTELTFYYMNLVTTARLQRNPTIKSEIQMRGFGESIPAGFFTYPISQASDITAFDATIVPVGEDQKPMLEQTKEIVHKFNSVYGETLVDPEILLPETEVQNRLPGIDGNAKMSKSLGNALYLSDSTKIVEEKVMKKMFTDPGHINVKDPGKLEGNCVFIFLEALATDEQVHKYLPEYNTLKEMEEHYQRGGLGDVKCKKLLISVLEEILTPIRERRAYWISHVSDVYDILEAGTNKAITTTNGTLHRVKKAMMIDYFSNRDIIKDWEAWVAEV